ncbi:phosphoinositide-3-kinase-interacting protein 1-like [Lampetra planeri]
MPSACSAPHLCKMFLSLHLVFLSVVFVDSSTTTGDQIDCLSSKGVEYRGKQQSSFTGLTCLNWSNISRDVDPQKGVGDHNYCRNPDSSEMPWCYVTGPDGTVHKQFCSIAPCRGNVHRGSKDNSLKPTGTSLTTPSFQQARSRSSRGDAAAVQPVMGISQRVRTGPQKKKDLGTLGYVIGILMMAIIIVLGAGITVGYFYKRGRDLKKQHEQRVYEREMQRITLPLSAFSNPTCELVDENTIVITAEHDTTPVQEGLEGGDPLIGQQAVTPGA